MSKKDPFKYFHSSREIIRLAVMMYVPGVRQLIAQVIDIVDAGWAFL